MRARTLFFLALFVPSLPALAATCETTIESTDIMQFNINQITVDKSCKQYTVHLKHIGNLPKETMGHNWVLTKESDKPSVATDGASAGLNNDYVKPGDARVIAHTKVIAGGQTDSVTFDTSTLNANETYGFFCSFPGHWAIMKGTLKLGS